MTKTSRINEIIENLLRWISLFSVILMAAGLVISLLQGAEEPVRAETIMSAGILALILTPVFRVISSFILFIFVERNFTDALISLGVLVLLLGGLFLSTFTSITLK